MTIDPVPSDYPQCDRDVQAGEIYLLSDGQLWLVGPFDDLYGPFDGHPEEWKLSEVASGRAKLIGLDGTPEARAARAKRWARLAENEARAERVQQELTATAASLAKKRIRS
jgi:hypothetical protein